jgi:hypothetical protein
MAPPARVGERGAACSNACVSKDGPILSSSTHGGRTMGLQFIFHAHAATIMHTTPESKEETCCATR